MPALFLPAHFAYNIQKAMDGYQRSGRATPKTVSHDTLCTTSSVDAGSRRSRGYPEAPTCDPHFDAQSCKKDMPMIEYALEATQTIPLEYDGRSLGAHMDSTARKKVLRSPTE